MNVPVKIAKRLQDGIKKFKPVIKKLKNFDVNESDTVTAIVDILSDLFGYDKYNDITSEYAVRKSYCDLAIRIEDKVRYLIEVKAVGITLKNDHIKQAIDYGANEGVDWVILTNADNWKIYKLIYAKPIDKELVYEFHISEMNPQKNADLEALYYLSKEGLDKQAIMTYYEQKVALNKYLIGQILLTDDVINSIKKVLKKISPKVKIENSSISEVLKKEVIKREVLVEAPATDAKKSITKAMKKIETKKSQHRDYSLR